MSYTMNFSLALGAGKAGLADLRAQLVDNSGVNSGSALTTGFSEIGQGFYLWTYSSFADNFRGGVKFYSAAAASTVLGFSAINPEEAEYTNAKTSTRAIAGDAMTLAAGAITAAVIATDAIDADAIAADAVTELQSGLATASALTTVAGYIDTEVAAIKAKTDNLPTSPAAAGDAMTLTSGAIDNILDEVVEGSTTMRQMLRLLTSFVAAKTSGGGTTSIAFRDLADTKDRILMTVDVNGDRSSVTLDAS